MDAGLEILRKRVADELVDTDQLPDNQDLLEEIKQVRIDRNIVLAIINEIHAGIYKGSYTYTADTERVVGDRFVSVRSKLLSLPTKIVRVIRGLKRDDVVRIVQEEMTEIAAAMKPLNAGDFRARDVKDTAPVNDGLGGD
jgi:hypothetical protein